MLRMYFQKIVVIFSAVFCLLLTPLAAQNADWRNVQIGSPVFVLHQPDRPDAGAAGFELWELRPTPGEVTENPFSGSRRLFAAAPPNAVPRVAAFGLVGFVMHPDRVVPGNLVVLDHRQQLWAAHLAIAESTQRPQLTRLLRDERFVALEHGAETTLFALSTSGDLVELAAPFDEGDAGQATAPLSVRYRQPLSSFMTLARGEVILGLHRGSAFTVSILTSRQLVEWNSATRRRKRVPILLADIFDLPTGAITKIRRVHDGLWVWVESAALLMRYDLRSGERHQVLLSDLLQDDVAGGRAFDFMGFETPSATRTQEMVYARVGTRVVALSRAVRGGRLSRRIVAADFFGPDLRRFGVPYDVFTKVHALTPRTAERNGWRRGDLSVRDWRRPGSAGVGDGDGTVSAAVARYRMDYFERYGLSINDLVWRLVFGAYVLPPREMIPMVWPPTELRQPSLESTIFDPYRRPIIPLIPLPTRRPTLAPLPAPAAPAEPRPSIDQPDFHNLRRLHGPGAAYLEVGGDGGCSGLLESKEGGY